MSEYRLTRRGENLRDLGIMLVLFLIAVGIPALALIAFGHAFANAWYHAFAR